MTISSNNALDTVVVVVWMTSNVDTTSIMEDVIMCIMNMNMVMRCTCLYVLICFVLIFILFVCLFALVNDDRFVVLGIILPK